MGTDVVLCFHCSEYFKTGKPAQAKSIDPAFVSTGFKNWKKALEKCMHEKSEGHNIAVITAAYENRSVTTQLSSAVSAQQGENRASLLKIIKGCNVSGEAGIDLGLMSHLKDRR